MVNWVPFIWTLLFSQLSSPPTAQMLCVCVCVRLIRDFTILPVGVRMINAGLPVRLN